MYPAIEPYNHGMLKVSNVHTLYFEECGNKEGKPVVFVHGGPGKCGGVSPTDRLYFDSKVYRIVLFDQRGAGNFACLEDNTTWTLVEDIEKLRKHLGIDKWVVFGGSWGSTLSLTYAIKHPEQVKALILRGIFMLRRAELEWFYEKKNGASFVYPDAFDEFLKPIPENEQGNMMEAYHKRLTGDDEAARDACAKSWSTWECTTSRLYVDPEYIAKAANDQWALAFARIENHFFVNRGFFETDSWILDNIDILRTHKIPGFIVQGRYDMVCPMTSAWELHKKWPEAEFNIISDAGHSAKEKGTENKLVEYCEKAKEL